MKMVNLIKILITIVAGVVKLSSAYCPERSTFIRVEKLWRIQGRPGYVADRAQVPWSQSRLSLKRDDRSDKELIGFDNVVKTYNGGLEICICSTGLDFTVLPQGEPIYRNDNKSQGGGISVLGINLPWLDPLSLAAIVFTLIAFNFFVLANL